MPLFKCVWPDDDVSFVVAKSKAHAAKLLSEVGDPDESFISLAKDFLVTLTPATDDWELGELGECMYNGVLPEIPETEEEDNDDGKCGSCQSYDVLSGTCGGPNRQREFMPSSKMSNINDMPISAAERNGMRTVLEQLCVQITKGGLPEANQLVAIIHASFKEGARGVVVHRDQVKEKGGTATFPPAFVYGALSLPVPTPESLLVLVEASGGIGSFVVRTEDVLRVMQGNPPGPVLFHVPGSTALN